MQEEKQTVWRLMRQDDNNNIFQVGRDLNNKLEAQRLLEYYRAKKHKQDYWLEEGSSFGLRG